MGVYQKIHADLAETGRITDHIRQIALKVGLNLDLLVAGFVPNKFKHLVEHVVDVYVADRTVGLAAE